MYNELSVVIKFCSLATLKGSSRIKKCDGRLFYEFCDKSLLKMSTIAQALSVAGTRSSGASVRSQNGKISIIINVYSHEVLYSGRSHASRLMVTFL